jgi:hypothetical protein
MFRNEKFEIKCKVCGKTIVTNSRNYNRALWLIYSHAKSHKVYELYPEEKPSMMNKEFLERMIEVNKIEM